MSGREVVAAQKFFSAQFVPFSFTKYNGSFKIIVCASHNWVSKCVKLNHETD